MFIITWKHCNYSIGLTEPKNVFTKPICWVAIINKSYIELYTDWQIEWLTNFIFKQTHLIMARVTGIISLLFDVALFRNIPFASCSLHHVSTKAYLCSSLCPIPLSTSAQVMIYSVLVMASVWVERYSSCYCLLGMLVNKLETMRYVLSALHRSIVEVHILISKRFSDW